MPFPFLIPLIGAALGAGTGALVDKNNRGRGALLGGLGGGALGFGAAKLPALAKLGGGAAKAAGGIGQAGSAMSGALPSELTGLGSAEQFMPGAMSRLSMLGSPLGLGDDKGILPPLGEAAKGFFPQDPLQQSLPELMKAPPGTQAVKHWGNHNPSNLGTPAINRDMSTLRKLLPMLPRRQQQQQQQLQPINVSMMDSQINPMGYPRQGGFFRG